MSIPTQRTIFVIIGIVLSIYIGGLAEHYIGGLAEQYIGGLTEQYIGGLAEQPSSWHYLILESIVSLFLLYGGYLWAKLKGRHWAWMFTMLIWPLGVLTFEILRNRPRRKLETEWSLETDQRPIEFFLSQDKWLGKQVRNMTLREYIGMFLGRYSSEEMKVAYSKTIEAFNREERAVMIDKIRDAVELTKKASSWGKDFETVFYTTIHEVESRGPLFEGEWTEYDKDMVYLRIIEIFSLIMALDLAENKTVREDLGIEIIE